MKKLLLSIATILFLASNIAYADNGKKNPKKQTYKSKYKNVKKVCPNTSGCICN